jgi:S1-C subfamily serine protease
VGIDTAKVVVGRLIRDGRVRRGFLGVSGQSVPVPRGLARHHGLTTVSGVRVIAVEPGSPAASAGLREGDLIVAMDGQPLTDVDDLQSRLTDDRIGLTLPLLILRGAERLALTVTPADAPA